MNPHHHPDDPEDKDPYWLWLLKGMGFPFLAIICCWVFAYGVGHLVLWFNGK